MRLDDRFLFGWGEEEKTTVLCGLRCQYAEGSRRAGLIIRGVWHDLELNASRAGPRP